MIGPRARTFHIPISHDGTTIPIRIQDDASLKADNLPLETWGSSLILASQLHHIVIPDLLNTPERPSDPSGATSQLTLPVLEIGAGTGLAGLAAAVIWRTHVTFTDLPPIVLGLEANVALNATLLAERNGLVACGSLDWHSPTHLAVHHQPTPTPTTLVQQAKPAAEIEVLSSAATRAQVILAADTIYDEAHPELLTGVVQRWLERTQRARMLIAYSVRVAYLDPIRELWRRFEDLGLTAEREGKALLPKDEWDDEREVEWVVWKWASVATES